MIRAPDLADGHSARILYYQPDYLDHSKPHPLIIGNEPNNRDLIIGKISWPRFLFFPDLIIGDLIIGKISWRRF